jgi:hypothetical protein
MSRASCPSQYAACCAAVRDAELYSKTLQIEHLKAQLAVLRRARFGRSSEKVDREIEQLELLLGELEEGVAENKIRAEQAEDKARAISTRAKPSDHQAGGRKPLPAHLPRERTEHQPAAACPCCGGTVLRKLGEDVTELLEYVPSSFKVIQLAAASFLRSERAIRSWNSRIRSTMPSSPILQACANTSGPSLCSMCLLNRRSDGAIFRAALARYPRTQDRVLGASC